MAGVSSPGAEAPAPKRKAPVKRKHTVARVMLLSSLVLAMVTGLGVVYLVRHLDGNIGSTDLEAMLGEDRPPERYTGNGDPLNILVMGDDSRSGEGNSIDQEAGGGGSDTTILVHLSADRTRAYAVSIPRDSIVDRPDCGEDDELAGATDVRWNTAFATGGPACTVEQFEQTTNMRVDHFAAIDFNGFGEMVDAVDGVPVCVPEDLVDKKHGIFVPAGDPSVLTGDEALDYVRARSVGELIQQNDISRIKRQQTFIGALVRKVKSAGTLTRLDRVIAFLNAATESLETDDKLDSVGRIGKIAMQLQNVGLENIKFVTVPTEYYPSDSELKGAVFWTEDVDALWRLLDEDKPLPRKFLKDSLSAEPPKTSSESADPAPTDPEQSDPASPSPTPTETETPAPVEEEPPTPEAIPGICA